MLSQISPVIPGLIPLLLKKYKYSKELTSYLMKLMSLGKFFIWNKMIWIIEALAKTHISAS